MCAYYPCRISLQLTNPLPDIAVAKALQLLGWAAACGDITLAQDPASIHQHLLKVREHGGGHGGGSHYAYCPDWEG